MLEGGHDRAPLQRQPDIERPFEAAPRHALHEGEAVAALGGEVGAIGARAFVQLRVRHDMVEEAPALGLGRVEPAGGEHEVERPAQPDDARKPLRAAAARRQAVAGVLATNARALGGEHRVAGDDDLHAAGQRQPLHRRHDGQRRSLEAPRRLVDGADEGG